MKNKTNDFLHYCEQHRVLTTTKLKYIKPITARGAGFQLLAEGLKKLNVPKSKSIHCK